MWNLPSTCYQKERFQRLDEGFSSMSVIHLPPPPNSPAIMRMSYDSDCLGEPNFSENLYVIRNPVGWTRKIQTAAPVLSFTYTAQGTPSFTQRPMLITSSSPVSVQSRVRFGVRSRLTFNPLGYLAAWHFRCFLGAPDLLGISPSRRQYDCASYRKVGTVESPKLSRIAA